MAGGIYSAGKRGGSRSARWKPMADINVTPMVDVMLVLLIIFMVAAPLLTVGVPVDLPESKAKALSDQIEPLVVSIKENAEIYIQDSAIERNGIVEKLRAITESKMDTRIYIRADQALSYGEVMDIMGLVNAAGFTKVALVAQSSEIASQ